MASTLNIPSPHFPMVMGPQTPVMTTAQKCNMQSLQTPSPVVDISPPLPPAPDFNPPKTPELHQINNQQSSSRPLTPQIPCTEESDANQTSYDQPFSLSEIIQFIPQVDYDNISEHLEFIMPTPQYHNESVDAVEQITVTQSSQSPTSLLTTIEDESINTNTNNNNNNSIRQLQTQSFSPHNTNTTTQQHLSTRKRKRDKNESLKKKEKKTKVLPLFKERNVPKLININNPPPPSLSRGNKESKNRNSTTRLQTQVTTPCSRNKRKNNTRLQTCKSRSNNSNISKNKPCKVVTSRPRKRSDNNNDRLSTGSKGRNVSPLNKLENDKYIARTKFVNIFRYTTSQIEKEMGFYGVRMSLLYTDSLQTVLEQRLSHILIMSHSIMGYDQRKIVKKEDIQFAYNLYEHSARNCSHPKLRR